jgi:hypothetical protein
MRGEEREVEGIKGEKWEMNTLRVIHELSEILNRLKGFDAGYTTANRNELVFSYQGNVFKLSIEHKEESELEIEHITKYLEGSIEK